MSEVTVKSLSEEMEALRAHMAALTAKLAEMTSAAVAVPAKPLEPAEPVAAAPAPEPEEIPDEILIAISAAVAAYLGKRAHIRTVRLLSSTAWAQQGRVNIQASHRLNVQHHEHRVR